MSFAYGSATATRTFDVKVTYYTCDSLNLYVFRKDERCPLRLRNDLFAALQTAALSTTRVLPGRFPATTSGAESCSTACPTAPASGRNTVSGRFQSDGKVSKGASRYGGSW